MHWVSRCAHHTGYSFCAATKIIPDLASDLFTHKNRCGGAICYGAKRAAPISEVESHISDRCSQDLFFCGGGGGGLIRTIDFLPFPWLSPLSITRFNFFVYNTVRILIKALLLALAKSHILKYSLPVLPTLPK